MAWSQRIDAHVVSFGPRLETNGRSSLSRDLVVTRSSLPLDDPILLHALPAKALGFEAAGSAIRSALAIYPVWSVADEVVVHKVLAARLQRVSQGSPRGSAMQVDVLIFDPGVYADNAEWLLSAIPDVLDANPVTMTAKRSTRLAAPPLVIVHRSLRNGPGSARVASTLRAALEIGQPICLGSGQCASRSAFLDAAGAALAGIARRGRASIAVTCGVARAAEGLEFAYHEDRRDLEQASAPAPAKRPAASRARQQRDAGTAATTTAQARLVSLVNAPDGFMAQRRVERTSGVARGDGSHTALVDNLIDRVATASLLTPDEVAAVLAEPRALQALARSIGLGDGKALDLVLASAAVSQHARPDVDLGATLLRSVAPPDTRARGFAPERLNSTALIEFGLFRLGGLRRSLEARREKVPDWIGTAASRLAQARVSGLDRAEELAVAGPRRRRRAGA